MKDEPGHQFVVIAVNVVFRHFLRQPCFEYLFALGARPVDSLWTQASRPVFFSGDQALFLQARERRVDRTETFS